MKNQTTTARRSKNRFKNVQWWPAGGQPIQKTQNAQQPKPAAKPMVAAENGPLTERQRAAILKICFAGMY